MTNRSTLYPAVCVVAMLWSGCAVQPTSPAVPIALKGTVPQPLERSLICAQTVLLELGYTVEDATPSVFLRGTKATKTLYSRNTNLALQERSIYHVLTVQTAPASEDSSLIMVTATARIDDRRSGSSWQTSISEEAEHDARRLLGVCKKH